MSASLVGSGDVYKRQVQETRRKRYGPFVATRLALVETTVHIDGGLDKACLLYTSDACRRYA
eukprot:6695459-Alexandrium_andersonii.AAC.1